MSLERNNSEGWKNWGDHPLFVLLSAIGIIIGIIVAILSYYKSDKTPVDENITVKSNSNTITPIENAPDNLILGLYVHEGIDSRSDGFSKIFENVIKKIRPSRVSVIVYGRKNQSIWSITPKDFDFNWDDGYVFSNESNRLEAIRNLQKYIENTPSESFSSKSTNIYDLKKRIEKDIYHKNILVIKNVFSNISDENSEINLSSDKKILILLMTSREDSDERGFYYNLEKLNKVFPTAKTLPFVSVDEKQITDFLQTQ